MTSRDCFQPQLFYDSDVVKYWRQYAKDHTRHVLAAKGHEVLKVSIIIPDFCVWILELLLECVLAVTSPQNKPVPPSVVSVEGQGQDVDPVEEEEDIWLTVVGSFGVSGDTLQKCLQFFPEHRLFTVLFFPFYFFLVKFWVYCLAIWILVGPGVCLVFMVAMDNLKHTASTIKVEKVWEPKYLYRSGPCCLILQRWRLEFWWLWAKCLWLGEKVRAQETLIEGLKSGLGTAVFKLRARLQIYLRFRLCWMEGKKILYWWEKVFRIVL